MALSVERRWAICWELALNPDDIIRAAHVGANLMPFLQDWGFTKPVRIGNESLAAGPFPGWFLQTISNFLVDVLSTGRSYSFEKVVRLLELTCGISPGSVGPRV